VRGLASPTEKASPVTLITILKDACIFKDVIAIPHTPSEIT